jgi:uncharacterized protein YcbK (DUF882 family)
MGNITEHFSLWEFQQPSRHGFKSLEYPLDWVDDRLRPLCGLLEKIRAVTDKPITITSGYRSPAYNEKVDGSSNSQHIHGKAADFFMQGVDARSLYRLIRGMHDCRAMPGLGGLGSYGTFVHVDIRWGPLKIWTE